MITITEKQNKIIAEFNECIDWEDKYKKIIEYGRNLPAMREEIKNDKYKLAGCQSQVWINAKLEDGKIIFEADSDASIVKGLIAMLIKVYSGHAPDEILVSPPFFLKKIGIDNHLSPTRKNGLNSMMKQIQMYAVAFKAVKEKQNQ